jgi:hypothetical protein
VDDQLLPFHERDVLDDQPEHAFPLTVRCGRLAPELGDIVRQGEDAGSLFVAEDHAVGLLLLSVAVLRLVEEAQLVIPVGLERIGDQAVVGINAHEALTCKIDLVLRAVDGLATERVRVV